MRKLDRWIDLCIKIDAIFVYLFLYLPIFVLVLYSFSAGRYALVWGGFSLETYQKVLRDPEVAQALGNSVAVALSATLVATVLGTLLAIALERYRFRGQTLVESVSYLPILIPEIVMAVGLLLFFAQFFRPALGLVGLELGPFPSVMAGHVAFGLSYVMVVVRARLQHMDRSLEEAALDLGARPWQVFYRVTLPMLAPAILSGALLAFTLSLDDFYITYFSTAGGTGFQTLPLYIYFLQGRAGIPPQVNAVAALMLLVSLSLIALSLWMQRRGG
ncbi:MAG: ABC transporter permease [Candidatus Bipolaricaulota bacterium]|nr:ABC transporter permease [Candidatus Bipolaricaulota bacterium]MCS7274628.1 ABC transporter permease [Candidatus Bipolaricaulota bacterium]MDW8110942.1 ABC transporter permease [Candidatus Bipolaricaulota bacterium]MDW8329098.1 ABC transporter permease [Candidatus Bipolaricaulota bacterium]